MKNKLILAGVIVILASCRSGSDNQSKKEELKNVWNAYYDALASRDIQKMNALTTGNFLMYNEGVIYNNETALKAVQETGPFTASFRFDSLNAHFDKVEASAYCLRQASITIQDTVYPPMRFLESATFRKENGQWKLRFLHSSVHK